MKSADTHVLIHFGYAAVLLPNMTGVEALVKTISRGVAARSTYDREKMAPGAEITGAVEVRIELIHSENIAVAEEVDGLDLMPFSMRKMADEISNRTHVAASPVQSRRLLHS